MVYRLVLTSDEVVVSLDVSYIAGSTIRYTLLGSIYEISYINLMVHSLVPIEIRKNITFDDIGLKIRFID